MKPIVVHGSRSSPLPTYRRIIQRFVNDHPELGWGYDPFADLPDLLPSITIAEGDKVGTTIEIIAHGSPTHHYLIAKHTVATFATALRTHLPQGRTSSVYLTGCNTGLELRGYCIAEQLANALAFDGVIVYGAAGFITDGAAATEDAVTSDRDDNGHRPYDDARADGHPDCWNAFPSSSRPPSLIQPPDIAPEKLRGAISDALRSGRHGEIPPQLIGPDVRGIIELEDGPIEYELLLGGLFLRDALTGETFEFPRGPELFERHLAIPK